MNKKLLMCSAFALIAMVFAGCEEEPAELKHYVTESSGPELKPEGFSSIVVNAPAAVQLDAANQFTFEWESGDVFAVYEADGDWVANFKISDAAATVKSFDAMEGVVLDNKTNYVALYPAPKIGEEGSYEDYIAAQEAQLSEVHQKQDGTTSAHLKKYCSMEVSFKGGDPLTFEFKNAFAAINFQVEEGETPSTLKFVDGDNQYKVDFTNLAAAASDDDIYTAYMAINPASALSRTQEFFVPADASDAARTIENCLDNYLSAECYAMNTFVVEEYSELTVNMPAAITGVDFAWSANDKISLYNVAGGAWVADCTVSDVSTSKFTIDNGAVIDSKSSYTVVYPAREGEATYDDYKTAAAAKIAEQSQNGDASTTHLKGECWMSGTFKGGEAASLEHQMSILRIAFTMDDATQNPTSLTLVDNALSYSLSLVGLSGATSYTAYLAVQTTDVAAREQSLVVAYGDATKKFSATCDVPYVVGAVAEISTDDMISASITQIGSAADLMAYLANPSTDAILTANIDLVAETAYQPTTYLAKEFNGNGKKISNLAITSTTPEVGLFKGVGKGGVIKNLTMESPKMSGTQYVGSFAGKTMEGSSIVDCAVIGGSITATDMIAGGVVGQSKGVIANCSFGGSVETLKGANAGGIVAVTIVAAGYECSISGCSVNATVTSKTTYAGGIVAKAPATAITNCIFEGSVSGATANIGGIVGESGAGGHVTGCVNKGDVVGTTKIGGIVGSYPNGGTVVACYNLGKIGDAAKTASSAAGIIGEAKEITDVVGCYNYSTFGKEPNNGNIGQITGYVKAGGAVATVTDCYYVNLGTGNSVNGTKVADIAALNGAVEAMNIAINATSYSVYNFVAGADSAVDTPTLIVK